MREPKWLKQLKEETGIAQMEQELNEQRKQIGKTLAQVRAARSKHGIIPSAKQEDLELEAQRFLDRVKVGPQ